MNLYHQIGYTHCFAFLTHSIHNSRFARVVLSYKRIQTIVEMHF